MENKEQLSKKELEEYAKIKQEEEDMEEFYGKNNSDTVAYKGTFVSILKAYAGKKKRLKISSFTHKNIDCFVLESNPRFIKVRKCIDGRMLYLSQSSIKDIEEI